MQILKSRSIIPTPFKRTLPCWNYSLHWTCALPRLTYDFMCEQTSKYLSTFCCAKQLSNIHAWSMLFAGTILAHLLSFIYLSSRFSCQHPQSFTQCWLAVNSCHSVFNLYSSYQLSSLQNSSKLSNHFSLCLYNITVCICCSFYCCCDNTYNYQVAHVLRTVRSRATIDTS